MYEPTGETTEPIVEQTRVKDLQLIIGTRSLGRLFTTRISRLHYCRKIQRADQWRLQAYRITLKRLQVFFCDLVLQHPVSSHHTGFSILVGQQLQAYNAGGYRFFSLLPSGNCSTFVLLALDMNVIGVTGMNLCISSRDSLKRCSPFGSLL